MEKVFKESGNFRIARVIKIDVNEILVECEFDGLKLIVTKKEVDSSNLRVGILCQVFRTTISGCILLEY